MPDTVLPDCMMPDGGEACKGYTHLRQIYETARAGTLQSVARIEACVKEWQQAAAVEASVRREVIAENERLRALNERMRVVIADMVDDLSGASEEECREIWQRARAILVETSEAEGSTNV